MTKIRLKFKIFIKPIKKKIFRIILFIGRVLSLVWVNGILLLHR
jgi:hypothetical protein